MLETHLTMACEYLKAGDNKGAELALRQALAYANKSARQCRPSIMTALNAVRRNRRESRQ